MSATIITSIASKIILYGLPLLEVALEQYAVHICKVAIDLIKDREERDLDDLKKRWEDKSAVQIAPSIKENTKFPKAKIDKLCFGTTKDSKNFKHEYVDVVSGYYTTDEVHIKIIEGTTPFAKSMKTIIKKLINHSNNNSINIQGINDNGFIIIDPTQLFDNYQEHIKHVEDNRDFGIPINHPQEIYSTYSYYNYYCIIS
jgi:hypothetical protein